MSPESRLPARSVLLPSAEVSAGAKAPRRLLTSSLAPIKRACWSFAPCLINCFMEIISFFPGLVQTRSTVILHKKTERLFELLRFRFRFFHGRQLSVPEKYYLSSSFAASSLSVLSSAVLLFSVFSSFISGSFSALSSSSSFSVRTSSIGSETGFRECCGLRRRVSRQGRRRHSTQGLYHRI